jgi:hypothetical protein
MSTIYMLFDGVILIYAVLGFVIGVRALQYARKNQQPNFRWLAMWFLCSAIVMPANLFACTIYPVVVLGTVVATVGIATFVKTTFYQGRRSLYGVILALSLGLLLLSLFFAVQYQLERARIAPGDFGAQTQYYDTEGPEYLQALEFGQSVTWLLLSGYGIAWLWHFRAGWEAYRVIRKDPQVEDWVKGRYKLMLWYSGLYLLPSLTITLRNLTGIQALTLVMPFALITAVIMQFLAWIMPKGFQRWLNRNYQPPVFETVELKQSEEEIMGQLQGE